MRRVKSTRRAMSKGRGTISFVIIKCFCIFAKMYETMTYHEIVLESCKILDSLNQRIWETGFNKNTLKEVETIATEINNGTKVLERIPQGQQSGLSKGSSILTSAGIICRGCPRTESEVREIYDTDDLIGEGIIQELLVEQWAKKTHCWWDFPERFLSSLSEMKDFGTESEVYFDVNNQTVRKLISLKHYNVLRIALDRIIIHNALFPDTCLKLIGFGRNEKKEFVLIVEQAYCKGDVVSEQERQDFMHRLGFKDAGMDYGMHLNYCTEFLYVGDLNEYNLIKGENCIHVIDADCRLNTKTLGCGGSYVIPEPNIDFSKDCFLQNKVKIF